MLQESMLKIEAVFASNHYQMAPLCMGLALVHVEQGRPREAQTCAKRAALLAYEAFGAKSARSALVQSAMAQVLVLQGCYKQAVSKLRAILDMKTRAGWNACHWSMALDRYALAKGCASLGRFTEALQLAELATDCVVQQSAGERERAAGTLVGMALRARFLVCQGLVDAAALLARSILSHPLCSGRGMAPPSSSPTSGSAADREGGKTGMTSLPVPCDPREVREEEHGWLEEGGMELEPVCIAAHLVLSEVCRIRGEQQQAVEHASTARELAQARYTSSHPTCLEAALEWACAYTVLGPTLSAHLEVEAVVAHAEDSLKKEYSSVPPMDEASGKVSQGLVSVSVSHPLQFRLLAVKALILSANNRHASAVEHARKALAGVQAMLAADNTPHGAAGCRNAITWGIAQSQLDLARSLMEAGILVEALQFLCSFFTAVDELWEQHEDPRVAHHASHQEQEEPPIHSLDGVREPNGTGGGLETLQVPSHNKQRANMPEDRLPKVLDQGEGNSKEQVQNSGLECQGGQKRDARLHKLGFVRDKAFVWYQDQDGSAARANGDERAQRGGAESGRGGVDLLQDLLHEPFLQSPPQPDKLRFSTLAALVQRGVASPLSSPLSSPNLSACLHASQPNCLLYAPVPTMPVASLHHSQILVCLRRFIPLLSSTERTELGWVLGDVADYFVFACSLSCIDVARYLLMTVSEVGTDEGNGLQHFLDDTLLQEPDRRKSPQSEAPDQAPEVRRGLSSVNLPVSPVSAVGEGGPATNFACNMPPSNAKAFCTVRLVEVEGMVLQVRLLVRMCRWQHALESIEQLRLSLAALHLHTHMHLEECELLEGMCLAGLARYPEAERKLRKLAQLLLHHRLQQGGAWSIAQQRVRYFQCVKAAGSIREILQDFVAASADYVESAQSWSLSDHLPSQHHPFVTEASFCTTRARMRGGLLSDMHVWHQQLVQLTSALGPGHPVVSSAQLDVCEALLERGAVDEAESILLQARTALKTSCGEAHVSSARCLYLLALVYEQRGPGGRHYKGVVKMLDSALDLMLRHSSLRHPALLPVLGAYARVCRSRGSLLLEHELLLRRWAVEVLKDTFGQESLLVDSARDQLVVCLQHNGRVDQARAELRNMLLSRETSDGAHSIRVCGIIMRLVDLELSDGHKQVDESRRHLFALQRLQQSDWQATRDEELHKLSTRLPVLEKSYSQRLQQAVKLIERSLSIKQEHQREERLARGAKAYPHLQPAAGLPKMSAVSGCQEAGHYASTNDYPLEACPELQRLGQVYGALGDIKEAERVLTSAIALCQREVQEARQAKRDVVPGHTRQEAAAGKRLSKAVLLKAETQRILAAMLAEAAGMSLAPVQAGEHARAAETLYAEALAAVSLELGPQHPRTEALKTSAAALCRSHHQFVSAQRLFED